MLENPLKQGWNNDILGSMTLANLLIGFGIGAPLMLAVGPISVLLLDQGLERGVRVAAPAALGVAGADLALSAVAAIGGSSLVDALGPITSLLTAAAVAVLVALAVSMGRAALHELQAARVAPAERELAMVGPAGAVAAPESAPATANGTTFGGLTGARLGAAFFGFTVVNPLTLVLLASVVVAGGVGVGTAGWAVGMALASLVVHGGWVVAGSLLGSRLGPVASGRLRLGAAVFMAALALHFALAG